MLIDWGGFSTQLELVGQGKYQSRGEKPEIKPDQRVTREQKGSRGSKWHFRGNAECCWQRRGEEMDARCCATTALKDRREQVAGGRPGVLSSSR